jgi:hypothetical protein
MIWNGGWAADPNDESVRKKRKEKRKKERTRQKMNSLPALVLGKGRRKMLIVLWQLRAEPSFLFDLPVR